MWTLPAPDNEDDGGDGGDYDDGNHGDDWDGDDDGYDGNHERSCEDCDGIYHAHAGAPVMPRWWHGDVDD